MHHDEKLQEKLISYIQDTYAMENQIVQVLEKQVNQTKDHPDIQAKITEHLEQTKQHRARMEQRLEAYGQKPSAMKGALSSVMGNTQGLLSGTRPDKLAQSSRDDYVVEHFEIAAYTMLMATAKAFGDTETMSAAEMNMRDEVAMQQWLAQHTAEVALMALQEDGIAIPDDAWQFARQTLGAPHPAEILIGKETAGKTGAKDAAMKGGSVAGVQDTASMTSGSVAGADS